MQLKGCGRPPALSPRADGRAVLRSSIRELSSIPEHIGPLKKSFYSSSPHDGNSTEMDRRWTEWLAKWKAVLHSANIETSPQSNEAITSQMKLVNPNYILREWFVVPAYQQATAGSYSLI
jgi:uncharacterized protein YdiU (UPF0061 family)